MKSSATKPRSSRSIPVMKANWPDALDQNAGGRPEEQLPFAEPGQIRVRGAAAECVQAGSPVAVVRKQEADVVDALPFPVRRQVRA